jgi:hypothetical protein
MRLLFQVLPHAAGSRVTVITGFPDGGRCGVHFICGSCSGHHLSPASGPEAGRTQTRGNDTMKTIFLTAAAATLTSSLALSTPALASGWDLLGTLNVREQVDVDTITLPGNRKFDRIRICAYRAPVRIIDIDVHYENGGHQDISTRWEIRPGDCTRNIDLNGNNRNIRAIALKYEENSWRLGTATVRVFGN